MKISVVIGIRKESYQGEYGPEVIAARDEFTIDENPEGWLAEMERAKASVSSEMQAMGVFDIVVDDEAIRKRLLSTPTLKGTLQPESANT
jgi:hypothetical protein